jgi:two-component system nitrogen regulation response regulator GlnG
MQTNTLLDISTFNKGKQGGGAGAPGPIPALTVVAHPMPERVGDRCLLTGLVAGREVPISRNVPDFPRPGEALGLPLSDPGLSRKPWVLSPGAQPGTVRVDAGESRQVVIQGLAPQGPWELSPEQIAEGVPIELGERVVVLLHLADPSVNEPANALGMVGNSIGVQVVRRHIEKVADLKVPVLIRGETGSGKELIAQALHKSGHRRDMPFMSVNLGAITKELAASELFGSAKGAFTGAVKKQGLFQAADGGTLFLDEVGEAPPEVQAILLRVLETGEFFPVGEHTPVRVDVRLVAATDALLEKQIQEGRFKEPLLHRLAGYEIRVPPLRERREDIGLLFHHFAREALESVNEAHRLKPEEPDVDPWLPTALASRLVRYGWPGNIRQLRNLTRQIIIGSRGRSTLWLDPRLEEEISGFTPAPPVTNRPPSPMTPSFRIPAVIPSSPAGPPLYPEKPPSSQRPKLSDFSEEQIIAALEANNWEIKKATEQLGVARSTLYDWLNRSPHVSSANRMSREDLARHLSECQGDLVLMSQRLKVSRWALVRRLKELGLLQDGST